MVEVIAAGSLCLRFTELTLSCDEAVRLQILERAQDCASAGIGFGHQRANRRVAREAFVRLVGEQDMDHPHDRDPTSESVAQSTAFELTLPEWSVTSHGSPPRPDRSGASQA